MSFLCACRAEQPAYSCILESGFSTQQSNPNANICAMCLDFLAWGYQGLGVKQAKNKQNSKLLVKGDPRGIQYFTRWSEHVKYRDKLLIREIVRKLLHNPIHRDERVPFIIWQETKNKSYAGFSLVINCVEVVSE